MDISTDKYKTDDYRPVPFLAILQAVRGIVRRLTGFFFLTEEERLKAGIFWGGEGRD
jgi:hypothetical protein